MVMIMKKVAETKTYGWKSAVVIPHYLVREIGDAGITEEWELANDNVIKSPICIDKDDLRISIKIGGDQTLVVPNNGRIVILENGDLDIEVLVEE
jgi:hypothetical protein